MGSARPLVFVIVLSLIAGAWQFHPFQTQTEDAVYVEETGHWVTNEILARYRGAPNPIELYGYPITEVFQDSTTNRSIQYFEKARFELHPEAPPGQQVVLSPLGEYLYEPGQPMPVPASAACRAIEGSAFPVCYSFLEFFDDNGGVQQFGLPISGFELQDGRLVQYFQRARFEWQPEQQRVILAPLGQQYFEVHDENPSLLLPVAETNGNATPRGVLRLRARAYPAQSVTGRQGRQTIYVTVQDQRLLPVKDIHVTATVRLPSGDVEIYQPTAVTNQRGITQFSFPIHSSQIGTVQVQIKASRDDGLFTQTTTSFRIWW